MNYWTLSYDIFLNDTMIHKFYTKLKWKIIDLLIILIYHHQLLYYKFIKLTFNYFLILIIVLGYMYIYECKSMMFNNNN